MYFKNVFILVFALVFSINTYADSLIGTMGCEITSRNDSVNRNVYVLLYGNKNNYTKICKDNIGNGSMDAMTCYVALTDAATIWGRDGNYSRQIELQRKDLKLKLWYPYVTYQCTKSKDPQSVENFVKNAKLNQLNQNQF